MNLFLRGTRIAWILLSVSCASYRSSPFDPAGHEARLIERESELPGVAEFAGSIEAAGGLPVKFDVSDGVTLAEAELIGLVFNGDLRDTRARLEIAEASAAYAGLWADPRLNLSILRLVESAADPWIVAADLALQLPLTGTPWIEKARARSRFVAELWRGVAKERHYLHQLRLAWIDWSANELKARLAEDQKEAIGKILAAVRTLDEAGEIARTETRLIAIEETSLELDLHHYTHESEEERIRVNLMLGLRSGAELELIPCVEIPGCLEIEDAPEAGALPKDHPHLQAAMADLEEAEQTLRREIRSGRLNLEAGPGFESDEGREKAGGNLSLVLPLWNRNRRAIEEARAARDAARTVLETETERLAGELDLARHKIEAAAVDLRLLETRLGPLADEQLEEARSLIELGELQALLLLEALKKSYETKIRIIDARAERSRAAAEALNLTADGTPTLLKETIPDETP